jgi:hypothetical protein
MPDPLSQNKHQAGRAALDAFLEPLISNTPWLYRDRVRQYLSDPLKDQIVEVVGVATRDTND